MAAIALRTLLLLMLVLATSTLLVSCASEEEKPLEQAEQEAGLEDAEQLQAQPPNSEQDTTYVARVTQMLECQVSEATEGMSKQEADTYLAEVFAEAHAREDVAAQDIFAEFGYDCGWNELQEESRGKEQDLMRSPRVPFSD